jgi:pimeloyl-ACP methyl ester carboxylesterase
MIPRVVYAKRQQKLRVHTPGRTLPIIVVPDIFGTRLTDPETNSLVWNPKGPPFGEDPRGYVVDLERMRQLSAELVPDETHPYPKVADNRGQPKVKHGRAMLVNVYRQLFRELQAGASTERSGELGVARALYFCGYDFRLDNARSALRLAEMVEEALEDTGESKVVLIGHGMGGQICRYYCRALGGEAKVHQTFLIGCPILGTPAVYSALKHGLDGLYVRELTDAARTGNASGLVFECVNQIADMMVADAATGARGALGSLFGELYMLLSLVAGEWLSRDETRHFVREMPSVYQLLPGALHCKENLHWVVFDPLATGVAPTGYMVPMPTVLELHMDAMAAVLDAASGGQQLGRQMQGAFDQFMQGSSEGILSPRASRNAMPFLEMMALAGSVQARGFAMLGLINWRAPDLFGEFAKLGAPGKALWPDVERLVAAFKGFFGQVNRTFIDCRNPRSLYEDPYTGLLDAVAERPLVSAGLPGFYRFDEGLTVTPREESPMTLLQVLMMPLMALGSGLRSFFFAFGASVSHSGNPTGANQQYDAWEAGSLAGRTVQKQDWQDARRKKRIRPRAYLAPNTYAIYSNSEAMPTTCLVQPTSFVSYDDSNVVRSGFIPNMLTPGMGDGFVPAASACPPRDLLSRPFEGGTDAQKIVSGVRHAALCGAADTTSFINTKIGEKLPDFLR